VRTSKPAAASSAPAVTSGRGPRRGVNIEPIVVAVITVVAIMGRKARPDWIGVKPRMPVR
jgi:hypothetical protein